MKISKYLGTFALLAMLAACSTEDEQVRFAGDEVKVNASKSTINNLLTL